MGVRDVLARTLGMRGGLRPNLEGPTKHSEILDITKKNVFSSLDVVEKNGASWAEGIGAFSISQQSGLNRARPIPGIKSSMRYDNIGVILSALFMMGWSMVNTCPAGRSE